MDRSDRPVQVIGSGRQPGSEPPRARRPIALLAGLLLVLFAWPATATAEDGDTIVVVSGPTVVERGATVEGVFVVHGDTRIAGAVTGDVVVLSGRVEIAGQVDGDVAAASGQIELSDGARVGGDLLYGDSDRRPLVAPQATLGGEVSHEGWDAGLDVFPIIGAAAWWLAMTISMLVVGLVLVMVFPRAADVVYAQAGERLLLAVAFGIAAFVAVPIAVGIAAATLVGIPLALALLLALLPLAAIAYATTAWALGRALVKGRGDRVVPFLVGLAILRALALIPLLGVLVWIAAVLVGLGLLLAAIGATRTGAGTGPPPARPVESAA
jgi:cytoskeletal protein CcmA (bactofilin family)